MLNEPLGSDIVNNVLYLADRDGGTNPNDPVVSVIRRFNMQTGLPTGETRVEKSNGFNDLEAAEDGTVYATQTGGGTDANTWQVWKITPDGAASIFVQGAPLRQPNGIAFDQQGNIVVVNIGNNEVLTFSREGKLIRTENAVQAGNDGLVIMPDGTKYVSSVTLGGVSRIRPEPAGGADRAEHSEPGVDVLRRRRESAGDSDERQQRDGLHPLEVGRGLSGRSWAGVLLGRAFLGAGAQSAKVAAPAFMIHDYSQQSSHPRRPRPRLRLAPGAGCTGTSRLVGI